MSVDKKELIIDTAVELFAEKGFEGTSIRDLAAKAEVNVAMINYYFGSKDKLFEAIVEHRSGYIREKLELILTDNSISEINKVFFIIEYYVNKIVSNHQYHRLLHQELMLKQREGIHEKISEIFTRNRQVMRTIIENGIKKKVFKKVDPELTIASIIGTINQIMLSKSICSMSVSEGKKIDPYNSEELKKRLVKHLKQLAQAHLLQN
jgi:AcrR family transcriptional regulator